MELHTHIYVTYIYVYITFIFIYIYCIDQGLDDEDDFDNYNSRGSLGQKQEIPLWLIDVVDDLVTLVHAR